MELQPRELFEQGVLFYKAGQYVRARECWEKSAKNGIASAMFCIGVFYIQNERDFEKAKTWFKRASDAGHKNAKMQLDNLRKSNNRILTEPLLISNRFSDMLLDKKIIEIGEYEWYVLKETSDRFLCLSRYIIDIRQFHSSKANISWEDSEIRRWLNHDFYFSFDESERKMIIKSENLNYPNPCYGTAGGNKTSDFIFLLSYRELIDCFKCKKREEKSIDLLSTTLNNKNLVAFVKMTKEKIDEASRKYGIDYRLAQNQAIGWWLRTPGENNSKYIRVNCNGAIRLHGRDVDRCLVGVRPALWLTSPASKSLFPKWKI